jgi:hypothetical protein
MQKIIEDQSYPNYLEQFSIFYSELENAPLFEKNIALMHVTWDFALFTHAVTNKTFNTGIEVLKRVNKALSGYLLELDTQSPLYDHAFKLYKFTVELQKQYEAFLQKKKR